MFEIDDGLFLDPWAVVAVKSVGEGKCAVFLKGQSAVDGSFLVNKPALEAATDVLEARQEFDEQPGDEEPDDEDDDEEVVVDSPTLLTHFEHCQLDGFWSRDWERRKLKPNEMIQAGLKVGLTSPRADFGQASGERCYELGADPGLESKEYDIHSQTVHLAAIADVISHALRKDAEPPWSFAEPVRLGEGPTWCSSAFLAPNGAFLRRVVLASAWSDERHYHEARSFFSLGEVAVHGLPMQEAVIVLGQERNGKKSGPFARGLLHPVNKKLRFRKRNDKAKPFKDSWLPIWREDHDELSTHDWLQGMLADGVLQVACFSVEIPVPEPKARQKIVDLIGRKLDFLAEMKEQPEGCLSVCDWPRVCVHRSHCHKGDAPSGRYGFVKIDQSG